MDPKETTPAAGTPAGDPPAQQPNPPAPQGGNGPVHMVPRESMKRLKDAERQKGRQAAMNELEQIAKKHGFASVEEAFAAMAKTKGQPAAAPAAGTPSKEASPSQGADQPRLSRRERKELARQERQTARSTREADQARQALDKANREAKRLQKQLDAKEAELALTKQAFTAGIRDDRKAKIALELLKDHVAGLDPEALKSFDEGKFFTDLKSSEPWLFQETVRPANTTPSPAPGAQPQPAAPAKVQQDGAPPAGQIDAMKLKREDFDKMLTERFGFQPHASA